MYIPRALRSENTSNVAATSTVDRTTSASVDETAQLRLCHVNDGSSSRASDLSIADCCQRPTKSDREKKTVYKNDRKPKKTDCRDDAEKVCRSKQGTETKPRNDNEDSSLFVRKSCRHEDLSADETVLSYCNLNVPASMSGSVSECRVGDCQLTASEVSDTTGGETICDSRSSVTCDDKNCSVGDRSLTLHEPVSTGVSRLNELTLDVTQLSVTDIVTVTQNDLQEQEQLQEQHQHRQQEQQQDLEQHRQQEQQQDEEQQEERHQQQRQHEQEQQMEEQEQQQEQEKQHQQQREHEQEQQMEDQEQQQVQDEQHQQQREHEQEQQMDTDKQLEAVVTSHVTMTESQVDCSSNMISSSSHDHKDDDDDDDDDDDSWEKLFDESGDMIPHQSADTEVSLSDFTN